MVVLSVSICTRGGKALVSRQFLEMTRMRVEGLFAAFPKLVEHAKQHTFVETDTVRYVYQPLENDLYLLLITTKASNIVEDLSTLRLLAKVVPDVAGGATESGVNDGAFDLILAFDEVISAGGYREEVTLSSIRTNLKMESHEEKMHDMIEDQKRRAAEEKGRARAAELNRDKVEALRQSVFNQNGPGSGMPSSGGMQGFGGGGPSSDAGLFQGFDSGADDPAASSAYGTDNPYASFNAARTSSNAASVKAAPKVPVKGMKLGGGGKGGLLGSSKKKDSLMAAFAAEDNIRLGSKKAGDALGLTDRVAAAPAAPPSAPVTLALEERLAVTLNRDGGVDACEVRGTLTLTAHTDQGTTVVVAVNKPALDAACKGADWTLSTHPKVDKRRYEKEGVLALKKGAFPANRPVGVLRWTYNATDAAPLTVNCWPEDGGDGSVNVNMEYELARPDAVLTDVNVVLPLGGTDPPVIESVDGQHKHDPRSGMLCWHQDSVDRGNDSGALEFVVAGADTEAFFPIVVSFNSDSMLCPIEVASVSSTNDGSPVPNTLTRTVLAENYQCV